MASSLVIISYFCIRIFIYTAGDKEYLFEQGHSAWSDGLSGLFIDVTSGLEIAAVAGKEHWSLC